MFIKNDSSHDLEYRNNGIIVVLEAKKITEVDDKLVEYDHLINCFGHHIYKVESNEIIEVVDELVAEDENKVLLEELEILRNKIEQESICHNDECKIVKIEELERKIEELLQEKEELLKRIELLEAELVTKISEEEKEQINKEIADTGLSIDESKVKIVKEVEDKSKKGKKSKK